MVKGKAVTAGEASDAGTELFRRGNGDGMRTRESDATRETPGRDVCDQPEAREGRSGRTGVAERPVVLMKPGNAGGGKGPWFKRDAGSS